ncbi:MAG: hypothetical protein FH756_13920 [Firmicutes bacterium]|nr:hypothetical protein [Bacillota bacterium]
MEKKLTLKANFGSTDASFAGDKIMVRGGYDISSDLKRIVYADGKGVKLFNLTDSSEKLLAPTKHITGSELIQNSYHSSPPICFDVYIQHYHFYKLEWSRLL